MSRADVVYCARAQTCARCLAAWQLLPASTLGGREKSGTVALTCLRGCDEGRVPLAVLPVDVHVGALCQDHHHIHKAVVAGDNKGGLETERGVGQRAETGSAHCPPSVTRGPRVPGLSPVHSHTFAESCQRGAEPGERPGSRDPCSHRLAFCEGSTEDGKEAVKQPRGRGWDCPGNPGASQDRLSEARRSAQSTANCLHDSAAGGNRLQGTRVMAHRPAAGRSTIKSTWF